MIARSACILLCISVLSMPLVGYIIRRVYSSVAAMTSAAMPGEFSIAFITAPDLHVAKTLAHTLVEQKLAGCVQIIPNMISVYEWESKIEEDNELMLVVKTRTSKVKQLTDLVSKNHPYDVCQVTSTLINDGNPPYLKWLGEVVPE